MRRLLVVLLCLFILIDVFLAITLFKQNILFTLFKRSVSVSSEIPSFTVSISNKKYLDKKLEESGLWSNLLENKYSVEHLQVILTDVPQAMDVVMASEDSQATLTSHSYRYDNVGKKLTLTVQANLKAQNSESPDFLYSHSTLFAIFNLTNTSSMRSDSESDLLLAKYMRDFFQNSPNSNFFKVVQK